MSVLFAGLMAGFSLGQAMPHLQVFQNGRLAAASLFRVIAQKPVIDLDAPGTILQEVKGDIELEGVDFAYPARPERKVFDNFSLTIPAGEEIGILLYG